MKQYHTHITRFTILQRHSIPRQSDQFTQHSYRFELTDAPFL